MNEGRISWISQKKEADRIIREHQIWLKDHNKGERADFSDCYICGDVDFSGANLQYANFRCTSFYQPSNFDGADLRWADFSGCEGKKLTFNNVNCENTRFKYSLIIFMNAINANFKYAQFDFAILDKLTLTDTDLTDSSFNEATVINSYINGETINPIKPYTP